MSSGPGRPAGPTAPASPARPDLAALARRVPKAEVHLHLEGSIPSGLVARAASEKGAHAPVDTAGGRPRIESLDELLGYLDWSCALVERAEQLEEIAYSTAARLVGSGALHGDVIFNPTHWPAWRSRLPEMIAALERGAAHAEQDHLATMSFCLSLKRQQSRAEAMELVELLVANRSDRLVALSIDGNEAAGSNTERFVEAFDRARRAGLRRTAHAGESSGPGGVREAVHQLGAERIDHGIRCVEDPALVSELAEKQIPLGICPSSNVRLGVVRRLADHPVESLRLAGVPVSLNTDDPELYGIDLAGEYERCAAQFGWGAGEIGEVALCSIEAAFAPEERKAELKARLDEHLAGRLEPGGEPVAPQVAPPVPPPASPQKD